jgi:hypothetical protein
MVEGRLTDAVCPTARADRLLVTLGLLQDLDDLLGRKLEVFQAVLPFLG